MQNPNHDKNERIIRRFEPDGPNRTGHEAHCNCADCPPRCQSCGEVLEIDDEDICKECEARISEKEDV